MTINRKPTGTAAAVPAGLAYGALTSASMSLAGAAIAAKLIDSGIMGWDQAGYGVLVILLLSAWTGAAMAAGKIKRRRLAVCLGSGAVYMLLLLCTTALFFGGNYSGVGETALLILCGCMLAALTGPQTKRRKKPAKGLGAYR